MHRLPGRLARPSLDEGHHGPPPPLPRMRLRYVPSPHLPLFYRLLTCLPSTAYQIDYAGSEDTLHHRPAPTMLHGVEGETPRLKWGWADSPTSRGTNQR